MQTGTWLRRGSTIELLEGDPPSNSPPEEDEFLSDLFGSVTGRARQGADYVKSRFGAPAVSAPPPATRPPRPVSTTRFPVPESAITSLIPAFTDYRYSRDVRYPWKLQGVSVSLAPPKRIDCCTFVEALLVRAWADAHGTTFTWSSRRHAQMMINSREDLFSPVTAMIDAQMGTRVPAGEPPSAWCVAQGWGTTSGHTFIIVARHAPSDRVLTLEANKAYKLDGVGYRSLGNLRGFPGGPPARWWENSAAPRWSDIRRTYSQGIALAKLNVRDASWAGLPSS